LESICQHPILTISSTIHDGYRCADPNPSKVASLIEEPDLAHEMVDIPITDTNNAHYSDEIIHLVFLLPDAVRGAIEIIWPPREALEITIMLIK